MLHSDNEYRRFVLLQLKGEDTFNSLSAEWLDLAESLSPMTPKALIRENTIALFPDGRKFVEVSYKREHQCVEDSLPIWSSKFGRVYAHFREQSVHVSDGTVVQIEDIRLANSPAGSK